MARLPEFGWNVTAVTPTLEGASPDVVQTEFVDVRQRAKELLGLGATSTHAALGATPARHGTRRSLRQWLVDTGYVAIGYPDGAVGWLPGGRRAVASLLASGDYHAVLSSAPPFTTNVLLGSLHLRVPWIADHRDLWADTDAHASPVRRWCDARLEHWSLRRASALTTISEPMARALRRRHPRTRVDVVPNAFDDSDWSERRFETGDRCTLLYAGTFHAGRRDPSPLFAAVRSLLDRGRLAEDDLRIDLYAPAEPWLGALVERYRLHRMVRVAGNVSREDVMSAERKANRLLVVLWEGAGSEGTVTGKLFEYLGARRRVIAIGGPERCAIDEILTATGAGRRYRSAEDLEGELLAAVDEHRRGAVPIVDAAAVAPYEAAAMAGRFARLLDDVTRTS